MNRLGNIMNYKLPHQIIRIAVAVHVGSENEIVANEVMGWARLIRSQCENCDICDCSSSQDGTMGCDRM